MQTAIGPVILISGIGLLLLTLTNRLGRVIDRARTQAGEIPNVEGGAREKIEAQLRILWKRAGLLRMAITLASLNAFLAAFIHDLNESLAAIKLELDGVGDGKILS